MSRPRGRLSPRTFHGVAAGLLGLAGAGGLLLLFRPAFDWPPLLGAWLLSVNVVAFGYYGFDKARARADASRVPEVVLHGLAFAGGSLGAYAAMQTFRHKTVKGTFRIVFWVIAAMQLGLAAAVVYRLMKSS